MKTVNLKLVANTWSYLTKNVWIFLFYCMWVDPFEMLDPKPLNEIKIPFFGLLPILLRENTSCLQCFLSPDWGVVNQQIHQQSHMSHWFFAGKQTFSAYTHSQNSDKSWQLKTISGPDAVLLFPQWPWKNKTKPKPVIFQHVTLSKTHVAIQLYSSMTNNKFTALPSNPMLFPELTITTPSVAGLVQ